MPLFAVHISDGILTGPWLAGGFLFAGLLALWGARQVRDEEIPQIAVLTAAFFVASLIHVRLLHTSVHLLLNGLVGVVLGRRAALAIPIGLFLQAVLIGHGGISTLGVNACVMGLPALGSWLLFASLCRVPWVRQRWFRAGLITTSTAIWMLSVVYIGAMLLERGGILNVPDGSTASDWAFHVTVHPWTLSLTLGICGVVAWLERRIENAPEFPLGLLVGETTVLLTVFLNCIVLVYGGNESWRTLAELVFAAHLPIAVVEGLVLGFAVGFLARVKPELLRWPLQENVPCAVDG
jgi:cobalt/nickel transport system permease protein